MEEGLSLPIELIHFAVGFVDLFECPKMFSCLPCVSKTFQSWKKDPSMLKMWRANSFGYGSERQRAMFGDGLLTFTSITDAVHSYSRSSADLQTEFAVQNGHTVVLHKKMMFPNERIGDYLKIVIKRDHTILLKQLLQYCSRHVDTFSVDSQGFLATALHTAVFFMETESVKLLIEHGADPMKKHHRFRQTAFHIVTQRGSSEILRILLETRHAYNLNECDIDGYDASLLALDRSDDPDLLVLLRKNGINVWDWF